MTRFRRLNTVSRQKPYRVYAKLIKLAKPLDSLRLTHRNLPKTNSYKYVLRRKNESVNLAKIALFCKVFPFRQVCSVITFREVSFREPTQLTF